MISHCDESEIMMPRIDDLISHLIQNPIKSDLPLLVNKHLIFCKILLILSLVVLGSWKMRCINTMTMCTTLC